MKASVGLVTLVLVLPGSTGPANASLPYYRAMSGCVVSGSFISDDG